MRLRVERVHFALQRNNSEHILGTAWQKLIPGSHATGVGWVDCPRGQARGGGGGGGGGDK